MKWRNCFIFFLFAYFSRKKRAQQHLDPILNIFMLNLEKLAIDLNSSWKNNQVKKNHPIWSFGSEVIVDLK